MAKKPKKQKKATLLDVRDDIWRSVWLYVRREIYLHDLLYNSPQSLPPDFAPLGLDPVRQTVAEALNDILELIETGDWATEK